ncbi:MAG: hypothetical protein ACM30E_12770 [Nitrososphaerales archaeon]
MQWNGAIRGGKRGAVVAGSAASRDVVPERARRRRQRRTGSSAGHGGSGVPAARAGHGKIEKGFGGVEQRLELVGQKLDRLCR